MKLWTLLRERKDEVAIEIERVVSEANDLKLVPDGPEKRLEENQKMSKKRKTKQLSKQSNLFFEDLL